MYVYRFLFFFWVTNIDNSVLRYKYWLFSIDLQRFIIPFWVKSIDYSILGKKYWWSNFRLQTLMILSYNWTFWFESLLLRILFWTRNIDYSILKCKYINNSTLSCKYWLIFDDYLLKTKSLLILVIVFPKKICVPN